MTRLLIPLLTALFLASTTNAQEPPAPPPAPPPERVCTLGEQAAVLNQLYNETPYVAARSSAGHTTVIFTSPEGSWTIVVVPPEGCVRPADAGEAGSWQLAKPDRLTPKEGRAPSRPHPSRPFPAALDAGFTLIHDIYRDLKLCTPTVSPSPFGTGGSTGCLSCCGGNDCKPYPHRASAGLSHFEALIAGNWVEMPMDKITDEPAPDGRVHVCCSGGQCDSHAGTPNIRCVMLPGAGA